MGIAADRFAAVSIIGQQLGFVTHADLSHFDPRLKLGSQPLDQLTKIDSLFRQVINNDTLATEQMLDDFFPTAKSGSDELIRFPLLAIQVTSIADGGSVIGMLASHMLVDGVGLTLFSKHCMSALKDVTAPPVIHSREVLASNLDGNFELPSWYEKTDSHSPSEREWEMSERYALTVFTVDEARLRNAAANHEASAWIQLTTLLCRELSEWGGFSEAAFWCNVRGSLSIPSTYTGNVGCYWHETLHGHAESATDLAQRLRTATQLDGSRQVAETYLAVKQAELAGQTIHWTGTQDHVLPINLVPYSPSTFNFGAGGPQYSRLLTRNVHGLRITRVPNRREFVVEASLPLVTAEQLPEKCQRLGLDVKLLGFEA